MTSNTGRGGRRYLPYHMLASHRKLATRVEKLEAGQKRYASVIGILAEEIQEIKQLPAPSKPKRRIGFENSARQSA